MFYEEEINLSQKKKIKSKIKIVNYEMTNKKSEMKFISLNSSEKCSR